MFRSIKTAVPAVLGILICTAFIIGAAVAGAFIKANPRLHLDIAPQVVRGLQSVVFLMLTLVAVQSIIQTARGGSLVFSLSQIDFTFPSPISRRHVLSVHLLKSHLSLGLGILFLLLVFMPVPLALVNISLFPSLLITWSSIMMLSIAISSIAHTINVVLAYHLEKLLGFDKRVKLLMYAVGFICVLLWISSSLPKEMVAEIRAGSYFAVINGFTQSTTVRTILFPITWTTNLALYPVIQSGPSPVLEFIGLLILAVASFSVLIRRRENIYEPSLGLSMKYAQVREAWKKGSLTGVTAAERIASDSQGKQHKSPVPPFGRGAMAIIWKNAVVAVRMFKPAQMIYFVVFIAAFVGWRSRSGSGDSDPGMWITYMIITGLQMTLTGIRNELKQSIIKIMPIKGWKVILAFAASQSIQIMLMAALFVLVMGGVSVLNNTARLWILVVPSLAFAFVAAGNLAVLIYPARNFLSSIVALALGSVPVIYVVDIFAEAVQN
jgi:hypothetical protein